MNDPATGAAPSEGAAPAAERALGSYTLDGETRIIERPSGTKASRALAELRQANTAVKRITDAYGDFIAEYERTNRVELSRVQAKLRYLPGPVVDPETGEPKVDPETGEAILMPHPLDHLTEEDWQRAGHVFVLPKSPSFPEVAGHVAPLALELAEERVYRLLALFTMSNDQVKQLRKAGGLDAALDEAAEDLLDDVYFDEVVELAVAIGETVDHHFRRKAEAMGDSLGNALRLVGLGPKRVTTTSPSPDPEAETSSTSATRPTSPSASDESSDGAPTSSSTSPTTSSPPSADASTPSEPPESRPRSTPSMSV